MQAWEPVEDPLPDSFFPGVPPTATPPKAPSYHVKSLHPGTQTLPRPSPSLTCNWRVQVVAEALAQAEELNGPELAAKFWSQPRDPLSARLQVMSLFWVPLVIQKLLSWSQHISHFFLQAQYEENTSGFTAPRRRVAKPHIRMVDKVQSLELVSLLLYPVACSLFTVCSSLYTVQVTICSHCIPVDSDCAKDFLP